MTLAELQRIKQWHVNHRADHPLEYHLWDAILTLWVMGWVGWLPAFAFNEIWTMPLCVAAMAAPSLYVSWRYKAHLARRLRCDWANS
ncbi:MAG: hypothetical protein HYX47_09930 [Burkholderiales bacterium]|nr:hypothetical protein [Burkholderiales bacterium]